jgi:hypothetical protein
MNETERIDKLEKQVLGLREQNRKLFELLEQQKQQQKEPEEKPSFEDWFKLKRR